MKKYSFDINKMIRWLMPYFLIRPLHVAWLEMLMAPVKNRYAEFLAYRDEMLREATVDSSVNRLTQALWDKFDSTQSIYLLQNNAFQEEAFIYLESDGATPAYDYLEDDNHEPYEYDYLDEEFDANYNFIVRIPVALAGQSASIYAYVKKYVLSGISFTVETF